MSQFEAPMVFNQKYASNNPVAPMTSQEIDNLRKRLLDNISDLNANKYRFHPDEYHQLSNYHHYALTILDNIKIVRVAEMSDPYNRNMGTVTGSNLASNLETINPYEGKLDVVYKRDGRATIVDKSGAQGNRFKAEWEQQFDSDVLQPPCFNLIPNNQWALPLK